MRLVPGNTYNEIVGTKTPYAAQQAVLTLDDLERWFTNEVTAYHNEEHRKLGISPLVAWERAWNTAQGARVPSYPADPQTVFTDLLPHESRAISREGINIHSLLYRSLELEPYVKPGARGIVRTDPRDISRVFLERPEGGHVQVPWTNPGWPRLSLWEWNEIRTRNGKRGKGADPEIVRRCLAENDRLIAERAAQGQLRSRRRRARAARWAEESPPNESTDQPQTGSKNPRKGASAAAEPLPPLPRTQLEVTTISVESPISFEVLE
jgi:putative transposase